MGFKDKITLWQQQYIHVLHNDDLNGSRIVSMNDCMCKLYNIKREDNVVRKTDDNFKNYFEHNGKSYIMERIPTVNLMGIKYILPMVGGMIDGYYEIERIAFVDNKGVPAL